ncbi:MAG TPA: hypothetical protein VG820_12710, partial [Fimbriimonadaceae bacterium]|nr:hypothetical protein [Fimbriimonadaceae bacterium]
KPILVTRPKPQLRVEQGTAPSVASRVLTKSATLVAVTLAVFFASSLSGQVMVEKARRDGLRAVGRAKDAAKEVALLRQSVQDMTQPSRIDAWAEENGFVSPDSLVALSSPDAQKTDAKTDN